MKLLPLGLLWLLTAAYAGQGSEGAGVPPDLTIYITFAKAPAASAIGYMKAEMDAIMAPLDMRVDWRDLSDANGKHMVTELLVVRFRGDCQVNRLRSAPKFGPLGWTHISDGQILPFTDVDCDQIRELMQSPLATSPPGEQPKLLGRAMARVIAHELYHFLGNTTKHASAGIAKGVYNAADLTAAHLEFDQTGLNRVRQHTQRLTAGRAFPARDDPD
jgi:hypothetical protein